MAGRGRAPSQHRRNKSDVPQRGEWQAAAGVGWQFGPIPKPPDGLLVASRRAWTAWFKAWFSAHWTPDDLPQLEVLIQIFDQVKRGDYPRAPELRLWFDTWGISPKGAQDRRWVRPAAPVRDDERAPTASSPYGHLKVAK